MARVTEVESVPGLERHRAADALPFHRAIREAVEEHAGDPAYREQGYGITPIAGIFPPTNESMALRDGGTEMLRSYRARDEGGDGGVNQVTDVFMVVAEGTDVE